MEKNFIDLKDLNEDMWNNPIKAAKFKYNRIKEIANKTPLSLKGDDLSVGEECFMIPCGCEEVIPVIVVGYELKTSFCKYNDETGEVDTEEETIVMDEKGNVYGLNDYIMLCSNKEYAEETRAEMYDDMKMDE